MAVSNLTLSRLHKSVLARQNTLKTNWRAQIKQWKSQLFDVGSPAAVIWIFGCQRSGTTFLENVFRHDLNSAVFGEFSKLTIGERKTVLSAPAVVKQTVLSKNSKYAVIRPLFESDRATELLNLFPNSVGVWLFRECTPVVDSMIRKWGDRFFEISKHVESDNSQYWRLEKMYQQIRDASKDMPLAELYARYWIERNRIPFQEALNADPRMLFLDYRTLVSHPRECIDRIMRTASIKGVWKGCSPNARTSGLDRAIDSEISEETLLECSSVYQQLLKIESFNFFKGNNARNCNG